MEPKCFSCKTFKAEHYHADICLECHSNNKKNYVQNYGKTEVEEKPEVVEEKNNRWNLLEI